MYKIIHVVFNLSTQFLFDFFVVVKDSFTPLPPPPSSQPTRDLRRLWVGNLDQRVTEFALLNILKPFGSVTQFDLLVHKAGPMKGLPRGYAFVTFETDEQAELVCTNNHFIIGPFSQGTAASQHLCRIIVSNHSTVLRLGKFFSRR